jgi:ATP-dependent DNA helicase RecQ
MEHVMAGRDTLVVMPTGSGKSAVYQVPALLIDGPTVVVSPLIALQRDQVAGLLQHAGSGGAVQANSGQSERAREAAFEALAAGDVEFIFLAPEQLAKPEVLAAVAEAQPSLFVVDEAHCISSWGHDFRPDYLRLHTAIERLGSPTVLALTATASPPVRQEIVERLRLDDPVQVVRGFDRPNLHLEVQAFREDEQRREASCCARWPSRSRAWSTPPPARARAVRRGARRARHRRGGPTTRPQGVGARRRPHPLSRPGISTSWSRRPRSAWASTRPTCASCCTPRWPTRSTATTRRSAAPARRRAGRGGAVLPQEDLGLRRFFASGGVDEQGLKKVVALVNHAEGPVEPTDLAEEMDLSQTRLAGLVNLLEQAGAVEVRDSGDITARPTTTSARSRRPTPRPRWPSRTARSSSRASR